MASSKNLVIAVGVILFLAGFVLLLVTEPAGTSGSGASGGIADVSEDTRPYFIPGILLVIVGILVIVAATFRKAG